MMPMGGSVSPTIGRAPETDTFENKNNMMRLIIRLLFVIAALATSVNATPQESDTLVYKGGSLSVLGFRFAPALNKKLYELATKDDRWIFQSSLWRGYTAVLQVREDKLYLIGVDLNCHEPKPSLKDILGFEIPDEGVFADFYTGDLFHGFGDTWGYIHHSAAGEQRKKLRKFVIEDGILKSVTEVETEKPIELIQDRIMKDIEMLTETFRETDPDDPFVPVEEDGEGETVPRPESK
jgi:hypothetical protein